jgi:2-keto-4-pentenoate hydratase/2-oxohepta-3-ene-1,7-dioic acid hydratase in catechol pathway
LSWLSKHVTLNPGDVVSTGTPPGVGMGKGVFLKHGDTVTIEIEGVGRLSNPCVQD